MDIEIITTKNKLSKSIVKQLNPATVDDLNQVLEVSKIGYYVRNLGKGYAPKVAVFQGINGWCLMNIRDWEPLTERPFVTTSAFLGRGFNVKKFLTYEERDYWLERYNAAKELCSKNHLIL